MGSKIRWIVGGGVAAVLFCGAGWWISCRRSSATESSPRESPEVAKRFLAPGAFGSLQNTAFVFVKPHANTEKFRDFVANELQKNKLKILERGAFTGAEIDSKKLIDQHYYSIASKATLQKPHEVAVPADKFQASFGVSWDSVLKNNQAQNALDALTTFGVDAATLSKAWSKATSAKKVSKMGGGFYIGLLGGTPDFAPKSEPRYVLNGFFLELRQKFVAPDARLNYFVVQWDPKDLSWGDFRGKLLGPTDPAKAPETSLRGTLAQRWKEFGLAAQPNTGDNGVHASASPFEALSERMNWLALNPETDPFGESVLTYVFNKGCGRAKRLAHWTKDPQVGGKSVFDALEDLDAAPCLEAMKDLANIEKPPTCTSCT